MSALDWPMLAPAYQPDSAATAIGLSVSAMAARPSAPTVFTVFIKFSGILFNSAQAGGAMDALPAHVCLAYCAGVLMMVLVIVTPAVRESTRPLIVVGTA